jgi:hypothetical protein
MRGPIDQSPLRFKSQVIHALEEQSENISA